VGHVETGAGHHLGELDLVRLGLGDGHDRDVLDVGGHAHGDAASLLLLVEVAEVEAHRDDEDELDTPAANVDVETGVVVRGLLGQVDLGTNDVSDGESAEHGGGGDDSLGGAGSVEVAPGDEEGL
jgi:hypothetical protein